MPGSAWISLPTPSTNPAKDFRVGMGIIDNRKEDGLIEVLVERVLQGRRGRQTAESRELDSSSPFNIRSAGRYACLG